MVKENGLYIESRQVGSPGNIDAQDFLFNEFTDLNDGLKVKRHAFNPRRTLNKIIRWIMVSELEKGLENKIKTFEKKGIDDEELREITQKERQVTNKNIGLISMAREYLKKYEVKKLENIYAIHKGEKRKHVIVAAHFDSITRGNYEDPWDPKRNPIYDKPNSPMLDAPGANDNATGVAAVLLAAKILSQYDFKYSIYFMLFNAEELVFIGSLRFAFFRELINFSSIKSVINVDMIGANYGKDKEINIAYGKKDPQITKITNSILDNSPINISPIYISGKQDFENLEGPHLGSDHIPFSDGRHLKRYLSFIERIYKNDMELLDKDQSKYHSRLDLPDFIDYKNLIKTIKLIIATVALEAELMQ